MAERGDTALERAKQGLQFDDLCQQKVNAWVAEDYETRFGAGARDFSTQFKRHVAAAHLIQLESKKPDENTAYVFRVVIEVGVRLVAESKRKKKNPPLPFALIEAVYQVDYRLASAALKDDEAALEAFAVENASYHLWPFWREYAMSQAMRMNLPKIAMPTLLLPERKTRDSPSGNAEVSE